MTSSHLENISPKIIFPSELPASREMIYFLILIHILEFSWLYNASPEYVPCWSRNKAEPRSLEWVNNAIVSMCWTINFKAQEWVGLQIILCESLQLRYVYWSLHLQTPWIREIDRRGSLCKLRFHYKYLIIWGSH
jgi:hypothetical protein